MCYPKEAAFHKVGDRCSKKTLAYGPARFIRDWVLGNVLAFFRFRCSAYLRRSRQVSAHLYILTCLRNHMSSRTLVAQKQNR